VILAALHDLALAGRAPALAAAYAAADGDTAADAAIDTLLEMTDSVVAIAVRRRTRTNETGCCAVLYPSIAEAARRLGALGDRRAFGHSIVGVAMFDRSVLRAEAVGRCWSRGRWLAWLGDS
jgi:Uncharacterized protein conserved in bacteria (DUF2332)